MQNGAVSSAEEFEESKEKSLSVRKIRLEEGWGELTSHLTSLNWRSGSDRCAGHRAQKQNFFS